MSLVEHIIIAEGVDAEDVDPFLNGMQRASEILDWDGSVSVRVRFDQKGSAASYRPSTNTITFPVGTARKFMVSDRLYKMQATGSGAHEATHLIRANQEPVTFMASCLVLEPVRRAVDFVLGLDLVTPEERTARNVQDQVLEEQFGMKLPRGRPSVEAYPSYYPARLTRKIIDKLWPEK